VEVALSVVLLSGATLLFETLWHMQNDHLGFRPDDRGLQSLIHPREVVDAVCT
jgi:hypothetical protein